MVLIAYRDTSITSVIAYYSAGAKHNLILSPSLLEQALKDIPKSEQNDITKWPILRNVFRMPKDAESQYFDLRTSMVNEIDDQIFQGHHMEQLLSSALSILTESLPDLVTFNSSIVDQMAWERVANIELTDGTVEAEADLFALINEFFCNAIIIPITGPQFLESYQLLASDLSSLSERYYALAAGLPRLYPLPGLPGAMLAKKRLSQNFQRLFNEVDDPPKKRVPDDDESMSGEETDADAPTPLTALNNYFRGRNVPIPVRAAIMSQIVHDLVSELVPLAFWSLVHIHTSVAQTKDQSVGPTLVDDIRNETQIWVQATQPPSIHPSFPAPPEIAFSGLPRVVSSTSFPHLRSCLNEARRLYKAPVTTTRLEKAISLTEPESIRPGVEEKWELDAGSLLDVGLTQTLINTSSANFIAPAEYIPDRFLHSSPPSSVTSTFDPQESLKSSLLVAFVAGILQLWEIAAAPKKSLYDHMQEAQAAAMGEKLNTSGQSNKEKKVGKWIIPNTMDGANVIIPKGDVRVRIRRREGLPERRSLRKGR